MKTATKSEGKSVGGYNAGHPWYYLLGNPVLLPSQIRAMAYASQYRGYYHDEIMAASNRPEPKRSQLLRDIRRQVVTELGKDISRYRKRIFELRKYQQRRGISKSLSCCDDIHVAVSLKHNHIYNGFAHLALLDELPDQQGDLFGV